MNRNAESDGLSRPAWRCAARAALCLLLGGAAVPAAADSTHVGSVADGTPMMDRRLERVLTSDPGMGVIRHADAGYEQAQDFARDHGVKVPMGL